MNIELTPEALINIMALQEEHNAIGKGLRFGLSKDGCSGYKYILEFEDSKWHFDLNKYPNGPYLVEQLDPTYDKLEKLYYKLEKLKNFNINGLTPEGK